MNNIRKNLPQIMDGKVIGAITSSIYNELKISYKQIDELLDQILSVGTSTYGIDHYEKEYGVGNRQLSLENRQDFIKARMRGSGTVTKAMIKNTAEAFFGGNIEITETPEEDYFTIKFTDTRGIPSDMGKFIESMNNIKPAHLDIVYQFAYMLIREIHGVVTIGEMEQIELHKFAGGGI